MRCDLLEYHVNSDFKVVASAVPKVACCITGRWGGCELGLVEGFRIGWLEGCEDGCDEGCEEGYEEGWH